jgi:hypothetical protein
MNLILNLEAHRIRQSSVKEPDHFEHRISLEGKLKCVEHDISLGGVQPVSEAVGILRLLDASQEPDLDHDPQTSVGNLEVLEDYGEWQVMAEVVLTHDEFKEIWKRLRTDKNLRSAKMLVTDGKDEAGPKSVTFQAKDLYRVEAVEVEFFHEF